MQKSKAERISLAAIGAGLSFLFVILAFYVRYLSISFNVLASIGLMLPMSKKYYKESVAGYVVVCVLGFLIVNINILAFVFLGGLFPLIVIFFNQKEVSRNKRYIIYAIYALLTFFIYFIVFKAMFLELLSTFSLEKKLWLYPIANVLYFGALLLYEAVLLMVFQEVLKLLKRIKR